MKIKKKKSEYFTGFEELDIKTPTFQVWPLDDENHLHGIDLRVFKEPVTIMIESFNKL